MQRRLGRLLPVTRDLGIRKAWAATIEYTPDHLPVLGPLVASNGTVIDGASIACACGHGMMWGPAVSRIAVDLSLSGKTNVVARADDLRMDRFDEHGRSPFVDPIALPFPVTVDDEAVPSR
jgi:sarcosine oxidase subunit beta